MTITYKETKMSTAVALSQLFVWTQKSPETDVSTLYGVLFLKITDFWTHAWVSILCISNKPLSVSCDTINST